MDNRTGATKSMPKISIGFELPEQLWTTGDLVGQPMLIKSQYTVSIYKQSNLRPLLESWLGVFESDEQAQSTVENFAQLIGSAAMVNISEGNKGYMNIAGLMPVHVSLPVPAPVLRPVVFTMDPLLWNPNEAQLAELSEEQYAVYLAYGSMKAVFDTLPEKTKLTISKSPEFIEVNGGPLIIPNQQQQRQQAQRAVPGQRPGIVRAGQVAPAQRPAAPVVAQRPVQHVAQPQQAYRPAVVQPQAAPQQPQRQAFAQPAARQVAPQRQAFQAPQRQIAADQSGDPNPFAGAPSDDDVPV